MRLSSTSKLAMALAVIALALSACSTSVTRMDASEMKDLSGAWNDTDSQQVSSAMIKDVLNRQWLMDFTQEHRRRPAVIVGEIRNLSHEHINVHTFVSDIERSLINSDRVRFVASSTERQEKSADFMLNGSINAIIDASNKDQLRYYQVDLNLISLADNQIVWTGQKEIKKLMNRSDPKF
jgi:hypothetical protein